MSTTQAIDLKKYCESITEYRRYPTREVPIGSVKLGGDNPIRVQSMTTADTKDTEATVEQSVRMIEAGCEMVRITAPSKRDAENLGPIKERIRALGYDTPLIADIHFTPNAAEIAADFVEKVRVNPGNYADKKKFQELEFTDESYEAEIERIRKKFAPLVQKCKANGVAMRIGTNHGSLSDRIMSRYGDTPLGMVESALEFVRICRENDYHDIVLSMKASNPQVMVQAYRLLVQMMEKEGMNYPIHLGVTEAGEGEDGRIKSAVGIGTLLEDGIGDTVRVSLTEAPEAEIPVAQTLVDRYADRPGHKAIPPAEKNPLNPFDYEKRIARKTGSFGEGEVPRVIIDLSHKEKIEPSTLFGAGYSYSVPLDKWNLADLSCDFIYAGNRTIDFEIPGTLGIICDFESWQEGFTRHYPLLTSNEFRDCGELNATMIFIKAGLEDLLDSDFLQKLDSTQNAVLVLTTDNAHGMAEQRRAFVELINREVETPVIINRSYKGLNADQFQLFSATDAGGLLIDGMGDGIWLEAPDQPVQRVNSTAFGILQASRVRISRTEYISCPSCGRTLFDLEETTAKIRARTNHLKGVKIGIMGCIVNGPGEMADAHYGYVGTGPGKITLYKEKEVVKRNVPAESAVDELIELIKEHGDWIEPETV